MRVDLPAPDDIVATYVAACYSYKQLIRDYFNLNS